MDNSLNTKDWRKLFFTEKLSKEEQSILDKKKKEGWVVLACPHCKSLMARKYAVKLVSCGACGFRPIK